MHSFSLLISPSSQRSHPWFTSPSPHCAGTHSPASSSHVPGHWSSFVHFNRQLLAHPCTRDEGGSEPSHCSPSSGWYTPSPQRGQLGPEHGGRRHWFVHASSFAKLPSSHSSPRLISMMLLPHTGGQMPFSGHTSPFGQISPGSHVVAQNEPMSTISRGHASSSLPARNSSGSTGARGVA